MRQIRRLSTLLAINKFRVPSSFNPLSWDCGTSCHQAAFNLAIRLPRRCEIAPNQGRRPGSANTGSKRLEQAREEAVQLKINPEIQFV